MQYDRGADGLLTPLPKQNIDTGAGLERVAALLQGVHSVYEADVFRDIISAVEGWTGARYTNEGAEQKALRVLADHGRAMTMLAADGVIPSNESRGYILRRIIRRAVQHGSRIGLESPFLGRLQDSSSSSSGRSIRRSSSIATMCAGCSRPRSSASTRTLQTGSALLDDVIERTHAEGRATIAAADAFMLHDTYGFPVELTAELAHEAGLGLDEPGFAALMEEQRHRARAAAAAAARPIPSGSRRSRAMPASRPSSSGTGRWTSRRSPEPSRISATSVALVKLHSSPFYAEGGGQVWTTARSSGRAAAPPWTGCIGSTAIR